MANIVFAASPSIAGRWARSIAAGVFYLAGAAWPGASSSEPSGQIPDLSGSGDIAWLVVGDELLPPPSGPGPVTFDKRHPYVNNLVARATGTRPTFRVADITNPILQPWAAEQMRKANEQVLAGKVPFRPRERCYPAGVPGFLAFSLVEPIFFVQTARQVTMLIPGGPEVRRVYLDVPHSSHVTPSWYGESIGHYEGKDTLAVDTIGISTKTFIDNYRTPHTDQLHVVERFRLEPGGEMLEVTIRVEDPGAFTTPWSAVQRLALQRPRQWIEEICAENNAGYFNYDVVPLPQADKPDF